MKKEESVGNSRNFCFPTDYQKVVSYDTYYLNICTPFNESVLWFHDTLKKYIYKYYLELFLSKSTRFMLLTLDIFDGLVVILVAGYKSPL